MLEDLPSPPAPICTPQPPQPQPPAGYTLTFGERAVLQQLNLASLSAKCEVYDLQVQLELAKAKVALTQQVLTGAVTLMANTHGMSNARLTPDMMYIVPQ